METNNENIVMEENEANTVETVEEPVSGEVVDSTPETTEFSAPEKHNGVGAMVAGVLLFAGAAACVHCGKKLIRKLKVKKPKKGEKKTKPAEKKKKPANRLKLTWKERALGYVDLGEEPEEEPVKEE